MPDLETYSNTVYNGWRPVSLRSNIKVLLIVHKVLSDQG